MCKRARETWLPSRSLPWDACQKGSLLAHVNGQDFLVQGIAVKVVRDEADGQGYLEPPVAALDLELVHQAA